ncbi:MAG: DUF4160 domain-containing protein [Lachnospiraceae bacterium]|nr:DUF4160 domain-containing protein [Lachnospiraceae bacterium]
MPVISRFYGIVIRMYFIQAEHNPPHIHAIYGDDMDVRWIALNKKDLMSIWNSQKFKSIKPLE